MSTAWVHLQGTPERVRRSIKDVKGHAMMLVRGSKKEIYIEVPTSELGWVEKISKDCGLGATTIPVAPSFKEAPCGTLTTDLVHHVARCKGCAKTQGRTLKLKKPAHASKVTVSHVALGTPELKVADIPALVACMKQGMNEALELAGRFESAIKAVEGLATTQTRLAQLQKEEEDCKKSLAQFLNMA